MYKINVRYSEINWIRVIIATSILIIICFIFYFSAEKIKKNKINKQNKIKQNEIIAQQIEAKAEAEKQKQEQEKIQKEKIAKRYSKLSNKDIEKVDNIYKHSDIKRVFLTFDDGPTKQVTPFILNLLKQENVKANFFLLGKNVVNNPDIVKQEYDDGHFIGNHSYSHKYSDIYANFDSVFNEYNKTEEAIQNAIGNKDFHTLVFRFPGGSKGGFYNDVKAQAVAKLKEEGIANVDWNALTNDADGAKTEEQIMDSFYKTIKNETSVVLLMHDSADKILTYGTLPNIIKYFKDNGYKFETIYDLLDR